MHETTAKGDARRPRRILILVENLPSPFDRRVWQEACALRDAGYVVSIICPTGHGCERTFEAIDAIHIYRYELPVEASGAAGYAVEYAVALFRTFALAWKVLAERGFDAIHACNPPDLFFLIGGFFNFFHRLLLKLEYWTFRAADVSIATNESYRRVAIGRGRMPPERVFVVRSGPSLDRLKILPPDERLKRGRRYLVGYVGVMGKQEGLDYLLRAVRHIVRDLGRQDIHFGLVGGGTSLEQLKALALELGIAEFVTFTGRVPESEMLAMLNTAEVCVNPDVANEMNDKSTMNKIMEYMALGKPMVQFDLTEGRYSAGKSSLYARRNDSFDLAKKLVELLDDPGSRAEMGNAARRRMEDELEWRHEAPKLLAAYDALWHPARAPSVADGAAAR